MSFFHSFPLISPSIFHFHSLKSKHFSTTDTVGLSDSSINKVCPENINFRQSFPHYMYFCAEFSTLTTHFKAEFSTPYPSFQPILRSCPPLPPSLRAYLLFDEHHLLLLLAGGSPCGPPLPSPPLPRCERTSCSMSIICCCCWLAAPPAGRLSPPLPRCERTSCSMSIICCCCWLAASPAGRLSPPLPPVSVPPVR